MIKIGVFGLSDETIDLVKEIQQKDGHVGFSFFTPGMRPDYTPQKHSFLSFTDPENLIYSTDELIISDPHTGDMPFIRMALRQSKPLFFIHTGRLTIKELTEIVALSREAETPTVCFNPVWTHSALGKAITQVTDPYYAEITFRLPALLFTPDHAINQLLFSLESILRLFHAIPKTPLVNVYSARLVQTDMIHVRLDFDNRAMALFKYEGLSETSESTYRFVQAGQIIFCDLLSGHIRYQQTQATGWVTTESTLPLQREHPLYQSWFYFHSDGGKKNMFMEDRLASSHIHHYIREKIRHKSLTPQQVIKNLQ